MMVSRVRRMSSSSSTASRRHEHLVLACIDACVVCAQQSAAAVFDACLGKGLSESDRVIRLELEAAGLCGATAHALSRRDATLDPESLRAILDACRSATSACADERAGLEHGSTDSRFGDWLRCSIACDELLAALDDETGG